MSIVKGQKKKQKFGADKENISIHECDKLDNQRNKWIYITHFIGRKKKTLITKMNALFNKYCWEMKWHIKWIIQITGAYYFKIKTLQFKSF